MIEAYAGWRSGSLALISDAGHMVTDSLALGVAAVAERIAHRHPTAPGSPHRAEIVAAAFNALLMAVLVAWIVREALHRLHEPIPVKGEVVTVIALLGLAVNFGVAWIVSRGRQTINSRAALLHVIGDMLGSIAALAAGVAIQLTGWMPIDPILSLAVAALIGVATAHVLRDAWHQSGRHRHTGH